MGDRELAAAYEATEFWVEDVPGGRFCVRCGEGSPDLDRLLADHHLSEWAYVTACNPGSERLSDEENAQRMRDLERLVQGPPCVIFHGSGVGTRGDWPPEPSLLVRAWAKPRPARSGPPSARRRSSAAGSGRRLSWCG